MIQTFWQRARRALPEGGGYIVTRTSYPNERTQLAHVLLEYGWQNTRLNPELIGFNNYS